MISVFPECESLVSGMLTCLGIWDVVEEGWLALQVVGGRTHPWSRLQETFAGQLRPYFLALWCNDRGPR